jgi:hypothetical protein
MECVLGSNRFLVRTAQLTDTLLEGGWIIADTRLRRLAGR